MFIMKNLFIFAVVTTVLFSHSSVYSDSKIASHAIIPITQKSYPKLFAEWGAAGVKRINGLMPLAAQKVAASKECDKVDLVELSSSRSKPTKNAVFFVDCANGKRFYVDESEIASVTSAVVSQEQKMNSLSDALAIQRCETAVVAQLTNPQTFDKKFGTTAVFRAPITGNVVVNFKFVAKNNLGAELPSSAKCVFSDRGLEEASISK